MYMVGLGSTLSNECFEQIRYLSRKGQSFLQVNGKPIPLTSNRCRSFEPGLQARMSPLSENFFQSDRFGPCWIAGIATDQPRLCSQAAATQTAVRLPSSRLRKIL